MKEKIKGFFTFFKERPVTMGCYGVACFALGALAGGVFG